MAVDLLLGFDGSAPHNRRGARRLGPAAFELRPNTRREPGLSEEVTPPGGSRFWTRVSNSGRDAVTVRLRVNWECAERIRHHDFGYIRHEADADWTLVPARRRRAVAEYRLRLAPGVTDVALSPEYNCADALAFVRRTAAAGAVAREIGRSRGGRKLWSLNFPSPDPRAATFLVLARNHAYESSGSYAAEGIASFLLSDDPLAAYLRGKFSVCLLPLTNPDGVHDGMSRLTRERGADLNRLHTLPDAAHRALRAAIDDLRPAVLMNVHNWTDKFVDGLLANEQQVAERIQAHMPADAAHGKRWRVETRDDYLRAIGQSEVPETAKSWKDYGLERFGATCVTFEFPWFGLRAADMREKGRQAFVALALAAVELRAL